MQSCTPRAARSGGCRWHNINAQLVVGDQVLVLRCNDKRMRNVANGTYSLCWGMPGGEEHVLWHMRYPLRDTRLFMEPVERLATATASMLPPRLFVWCLSSMVLDAVAGQLAGFDTSVKLRTPRILSLLGSALKRVPRPAVARVPCPAASPGEAVVSVASHEVPSSGIRRGAFQPVATHSRAGEHGVPARPRGGSVGCSCAGSAGSAAARASASDSVANTAAAGAVPRQRVGKRPRTALSDSEAELGRRTGTRTLLQREGRGNRANANAGDSVSRTGSTAAGAGFSVQQQMKRQRRHHQALMRRRRLVVQALLSPSRPLPVHTWGPAPLPPGLAIPTAGGGGAFAFAEEAPKRRRLLTYSRRL